MNIFERCKRGGKKIKEREKKKRNLKWDKERGKEEIKDKHKFRVITFSIFLLKK